VAEPIALVKRVTRPDSTEVRPVSPLIIEESWVATLLVLKPWAEVRAVRMETIAPKIVRVSQTLSVAP
jgi:hypothetical protein